MINKFKKIFGNEKEVVVCFGDYEQKQHMKFKEATKGKGMRTLFRKAGFQTFKHCYDAGVNFKNTGDTLIIAPQFICEKKHIDEIIDKLRTGILNYTKS